jgi:hypothetical protein
MSAPLNSGADDVHEPINKIPSVPREVGSGERTYPYSLAADYEAPATLRYAARLLKHADEFEDARRRVQAATRSLRRNPTDETRKQAAATLKAFERARARLARSRWRMQEAIEAETGRREPWFRDDREERS